MQEINQWSEREAVPTGRQLSSLQYCRKAREAASHSCGGGDAAETAAKTEIENKEVAGWGLE